MDTDNYIKGGKRQLTDEHTYQYLNNDPTRKHLKIVSKSTNKIKVEDKIKEDKMSKPLSSAQAPQRNHTRKTNCFKM